MPRRSGVIAVLGVALVAAGLMGGTATAAPAVPTTVHVAAALHRTTVVHLRPVTGSGLLGHGYTVAHRYGAASCSSGSEAVGDAYRCFTAAYVVDPCWVTTDQHYVDCLPEAWSHRVTRLHVTKGYDNGGFPAPSGHQPWGVRLADGTRCGLLQGATSTVHGRRVSYSCTKRTVLVGTVDRSHPVWQLSKAHVSSSGHYTLTGQVKVRTAWFGKATRKG